MTQLLLSALKENAGIEAVSLGPVSGGDISEAYLVTEASGLRFFVKTHPGSASAAMFCAEAAGLREMWDVIPDHIPEVIHVQDSGPVHFLVLEYLEPKPPTLGAWTKLGEVVATLHHHTADHFGFHQDNFIGSLHQGNTPSGSWPGYYATERILPQVEIGSATGIIDIGLRSKLEDLVGRFDDLLGHQPAPSLLHGDLWSGNAHFSHRPYLVDPATYYGDPEVDLAMTRLFGGFNPAFYDAYLDQSALPPGVDDRQPLYQLYYLLVHVNLFGSGYLGGVQRVVNRYGGRKK